MKPSPTRRELDRVLADNARHAEGRPPSELGPRPTRRLAVLACMDVRLTMAALGLGLGEAHVVRNAGGLATQDAIRSLVVSHQLLGTDEALVVGHTGCGLLGLHEEEVARELAARTGMPLHLPLGAFDDLAASVRAQVRTIRGHPWLRDLAVHGLIFDVATGRLAEVDTADEG